MKTINNLGNNIVKLRKVADITQERLAEQVGVSVSAISQWESGRTMPDICTIPILCHVLNVSSDELLEINREKDDAEIKRMDDEANRLMQRAHYSEAEGLLTEALGRFPGSYELMSTMMYLCYNIGTANHCKGAQESKEEDDQHCETQDESYRKKYLQKCIELAQKILSGCRDSLIVNGARQMLCYSYDILGETEKAIAIAREMPSMVVSRETMLSIVGKGHDRYESRQREMLLHVQMLCNMLDCNVKFEDGSFAYTREEEAALAQKVIDLLHILFEDGDFLFFQHALMCAHYHVASIAARYEKDCEKTLFHLKEAADHGEAFLKNVEGKTYTSLFLRGREYNGFSVNDKNNATAWLLEFLKENCFDFVRQDPRFIALENRLQKTAGTW